MSKDNDDILRYRNNQMSEKERNAFERRAMLDPFLSDALEGAETVDPALFTDDINQITNELRKSKPSGWLMPVRIAAGIFLVVVAGWLIFRDTGIAPEPLALQKEDSITTSVRDSSSQLLTLAKPETESTTASGASKSTDSNQKDATKSIESTDKVADDARAAGPGVSTQAPTATPVQLPTEVATTDAELREADESRKAEATEPSSRVKQAQPMISQGRSQTLQSKDISETQSEVIILPLQVQPDASTSLAAPVGGMDAYRHYLAENKRMPRQAQSARIQGEATISFTIQPDGTLTSITALKSLGYGCDDEVIRLITAGPAWTPTIHQGKPLATTVWVTLAFDGTR